MWRTFSLNPKYSSVLRYRRRIFSNSQNLIGRISWHSLSLSHDMREEIYQFRPTTSCTIPMGLCTVTKTVKATLPLALKKINFRRNPRYILFREIMTSLYTRLNSCSIQINQTGIWNFLVTSEVHCIATRQALSKHQFQNNFWFHTTKEHWVNFSTLPFDIGSNLSSNYTFRKCFMP